MAADRLKVRRWLWCAGVGLGAGVVALAALYGLAELAIRLERRAWSREDPPGAAAIAQQPTGPANATARRLVELAQPLGLDLRGTVVAEDELGAVADAVEDEGRKGGDLPDDDDPSRKALLERHRATLTAIESLLLEAEPPDWPRTVRSFDPPRPPLAGLRALNALLLARALDRDRRGDAPGVARALDASSRLEDRLRDRTERLSQVGAAVLARARAGVLRRLSRAPEGWPGRLGAHDFRASFAAAYQTEARLQMEYARRTRFEWAGLTGGRSAALPERLRPVDRALTTPFARWCAADASRRLRAVAAALRAVDPCRADPVALERAALGEVPRWNPVARSTLAGAAGAWLSVADVEIQEELTRVVLETRARPPERADTVASGACGGLLWTRTPDAGAVIVSPSGVALPVRARGATWDYRVAARR